MHQGFGGNPYGPAGTGKTESVKALGAAVGRQVLVFNCDEGIDFQARGGVQDRRLPRPMRLRCARDGGMAPLPTVLRRTAPAGTAPSISPRCTLRAGHGAYLHGPREVRRLGLLRRVQPTQRGPALGRVAADPKDSGGHTPPPSRTPGEQRERERESGERVQRTRARSGHLIQRLSRKAHCELSRQTRFVDRSFGWSRIIPSLSGVHRRWAWMVHG